MKIRVEITKMDNRYLVEVLTFDFLASELEQMSRVGEPRVETGGSFAGSFTRPDEAPVATEFILPTLPRRIKSEFPIAQYFDLNDDVNADGQSKVWSDTIVSRLTSAKLTLMTATSPFEAETVVTV